MALDYYILDVFTERALGGNPLAVVHEADRLTAGEMQAIAREFNLSETVFVRKPTAPGHTAKIRIFTPTREVPFAGHPTLGTAALLAELRMPVVNGERDAIIALEEEIGSVRVGVRLRAGAGAFGEFDAPKLPGEVETLGQRDELAAALGLIASEIGFENHKPTVVRDANVFAYVPIANLEAMSKVRVTAGHWSRVVTDKGIMGVYLYTRQCVRSHSAFHARLFAPDVGVPEDPATGSASIGFARVVHHFDDLTEGTHKLQIEQGIEMGRPSNISLAITIEGDKLTGVRIGGHVVRVAQGTLNL
ncbi:MAG: PhzF family phenazine biosynthesis protein [Hyphomicrobiaceae bacterium]|nr:PhzF family phenazine biosynthesis protein [Hyphomicrobiaceae bacterium]